MEAVSLRQLPALDNRPRPAPEAIDWDAIYEDPDLAPYRASRKERPELPLTAFV